MTLNLPAPLPRQLPLTPGPSHNKGWSPLILAWIFERPAGSLTLFPASICNLMSPSVHKDKAFVLPPRRCTRLSPDFPNRLCFPCQSNGGQSCFISDSMMKSVETILYKYHQSTWFSFQLSFVAARLFWGCGNEFVYQYQIRQIKRKLIHLMYFFWGWVVLKTVCTEHCTTAQILISLINMMKL